MKKKILILVVIFIAVFVLVNIQSIRALESRWKLVVRVKGDVDSQRFQKTTWKKIWQSRMLANGDKARTHSDSRANIRLADQSVITIGENTIVEMSQFELTPKSRLVKINLLVGKLRVKVSKFLGKKSKFEVTTPTAVLAARGTDFYCEQSEQSSTAGGFPVGVLGQLGGPHLNQQILTQSPVAGSFKLIVFDGVVTAQIGTQTLNVYPGQTLTLGALGVAIAPTPPGRASAPGAPAPGDADLQSPDYGGPGEGPGPKPPSPTAGSPLPSSQSMPIYNPSATTGDLPVIIQ